MSRELLVSISAIVPAFNSAATMAECLAPLFEMLRRQEIVEIIVVDDGSTDATASIASAAGARVLSSRENCGPGAARNRGAQAARGDVLWFLDSDTIAHDDAARIVASTLEATDVMAVFGAYDDRPPAAGFWSQYKNLVHHHYHHQSSREAETFWTGCGAVRKAAFFEVGGFDAATYRQPSIEDIELGWRLRQSNMRILLKPELQVTHLKAWRLPHLLYTEIYCRALPWSRLIHTRTGWLNALNVSRAERGRALLAMAFAGSLLLAQWALWLPLAALMCAVVANRNLVALLHRRKGARFAFAAILFHQVYYLYCSGAVIWSWQEHHLNALSAEFARRSLDFKSRLRPTRVPGVDGHEALLIAAPSDAESASVAPG